MNQIPLQRTFKNIDGNEMTKDGAPPAEDRHNLVTMRDVCIIALTAEFPEDQNPVTVLQDKLKRFELWQKFQDTTPTTETLSLSPADCLYLHPRVARSFGVMVSGPALKLLGA